MVNNVFQSTRPRGARPQWMRRQETAARFQSTRPRGARPAVCVMTMATDLFQSTRPRGARHGVSQFIAAAQQFQSTRPRGARRSAHMSSIGERCFNPRAHEGRDRHLRAKCYIWDLFQSTRPRGARHVRLRREVLRRPVSIHAPTRGATRRQDDGRGRGAVSIHAPTRGATQPRRLPA